MNSLRAIMAAIGLSISAGALAGDAFTDAMSEAYPAYRAALFRTNSKAQAESEQAIARIRGSWATLVSRYGEKPPAPYDRDPDFAPMLGRIGQVFETANTEISAGKLPAAHETLEAARDLMAELRRRNGVIVYSDHMNAYHAEMEHVLIGGAKLLDQAQGFMLLMARLGALDYLAQRLSSEAPAALIANPEFTAAIKALEASLADLRNAVLAQDAAKVKAALPKIKPPYAKLFLKFG